MSGVIVLKEKGQLVPEQYWQKVLDVNKSCSGFALATNGVIELGKLGKVDSLKELQELHEAGKEYQIVNFFGGGNPVSAEDLQPFVILQKDNKPVLVVFLEGDFNAYGKTDSAHTNEYHLVNNILMPKAKQLFRLCGEDIGKFMGEIADPVTQNELISAVVPRGTVTLIAGNGMIFSFEKNEDKGKFPWGWTSNTYGYAENTYPAKEEGATQAPSSAMSALKDKLLGKKVVAKPEPASIIPSKDTAQATVLHSEEVARLGSPPKEVQGKGAIKKWYRNNAMNGVLPQNWAERPEVPLKRGVVKSFKDIVPVVASTEPIKQDNIKPKDTAAKHIPAPDPKPQVPIIPAAHKKDIVDRFLKTVDTNSQEIIDPKVIQALEDKLPTFCEQVGLKGLEETFRWSFKSLRELAEISPDAVVTLLMNYRTAYILTLRERPAGEKVDVVDTTHTEPVRPAQQVKRRF